MSGIGRASPRTCSGMKTLRRRMNNQEMDNAILIDVDSEHVDDVIIIDVPEFSAKKFRGPSKPMMDKKWSNVIYIDDDETLDNSQSDVGFNHVDSSGLNNGCSAANASSSRNPSPTGMKCRDAAAKECQFPQENVTPVRLSKCKRTYSRKGCARNHYGLDTDSVSDSSDSDDYPDCELMEDSSGKVQEQWEKAFFRRRKDIHSGHSGFGDHDSTSRGINENHHQDVETESQTRQQKNATFCSKTSTLFDEPESPISSTKNYARCTHDPTTDDFFPDSPSDVRGNNSYACVGSNSPFISTKLEDRQGRVSESSRRHVEERWEHPASPTTSHQEQSPEEVNCRTSFKDAETLMTEPCLRQCQTHSLKDSCCGKGSSVEHEPTMYKCRNSFETEAASNSSFRKENNKIFERISGSVKRGEHFKPLHPCATGGATEVEDILPEISPVRSSTLPAEQANQCFSRGNTVGSVSGNSHSSKNFVFHEGDMEKRCHQENRQRVPEMSLSNHVHLKEARIVQDDPISNGQLEEVKDDNLHNQNGDALVSVVENCMISEREKLKETEEYKRAIEEEWASRQQVLQIQAEEAQRLRQLRKRRKAEAMRLLDMERRQKQRLEEMRDVQKRDEENMNLKEVIRAEVRKDLKKLEASCRNMASLLHCLGICVGGWPQPLPQEVQTAYKRALLTFHPDRVSRSDIRLQVEAEEKFKLVNRWKDKLSTCL